MTSRDGTYRPEIDGLRAVAVLAVIAFHAGAAWMPGGFLGVDVFFVISGYLISRIILADLAAGRFSLLTFYERRARRILPGLFLVMLATVPLSWVLLPPEGFDIYLGSLWATALFGSNIYFLFSNGYFQPAAELQPLLHTWSLAVEEQFYVVFPLLLAAAWRWLRGYLIQTMLVLIIISFALCLLQVEEDPSATFYLIHTRAWELAAGVIAALCAKWFTGSARSEVRQVMALAGFVAISAGFLFTNESDPLPGWKSLLPVAGTVLLLIHATQETWVARTLSVRPLVMIGLVSYSAYLWHHPLFAFARHYTINAPSGIEMATLAFVSIALAYLSWRYVETPWRNRSVTSARLVFSSAAAGTLVLVGLGAAGQATSIAEGRFDKAAMAEIMPPLSKAEDCIWQKPDVGNPEIEFCDFGLASVAHPVVLWGDSHARALKGELDSVLKGRAQSGVLIDGNTCLRTPGIYPQSTLSDKRIKRCENLQAALFRALGNLRPSRIILTMRWTFRVFPVPGAGRSVSFDNGEGGIESETERVMVAQQADGSWSPGPAGKAKALQSLVDRLAAIAPVTIVGPVPEVGWNVGETNFKAVLVHHGTKPEISTSAAVFRERNSFILSVLSDVEKSGKAKVVWPQKLLCTAERCIAQTRQVSYYGDDDHLSGVGARMVLDEVFALP